MSGAAPLLRLLARLVLAALILAPTAALAQAAPAPFTTFYRYDAMRRLVGTIAPDPDGAGPLHYPAVRNSYDDAGRLVRVEKGELAAWQDETVAPKDWAGFTVLETADTAYDMLDRPVTQAVLSPSGPLTLTQTSYDAVGRVDCVAVRMNPASWSSLPASACTLTAQGPDGPDRITHNAWDDAGQLLKVQKAYATPLQQDYATYDYTPNGKQKAVTDANGNRAEMTWDGHDRQARWTFPSPVSPQPGQAGTVNAADYEEYGYDANGNRTSLRKRDGVTIAYAYDALNRVVQKIVPASASGAAAYAVVYGYDNRGLETSARFGADAGPGVADSYDNAGRLVAATTTMDGAARTLSATYDADGNRTGLSGPWGYTAGFAYDGLDRLWGTSESGYATTQLTYDAAGRRAGLASGFGTMTSSASSLYDAAGRLQVHAHDLAGTAADQSVTFGYNPASQITSEARANDAYASTTAYNVNRSYAANGLNQYTAAGSAQLAYDANGNLAASPAGDGGTVAYVYDAENRLVSATTSGGTGGTRVVTLSYDPNGRLWQVAAPSGTTRFVYDGDQILIEADGAGSLLRAYVHGTAEDEPLLWYEALPGGASRRFLHADHQGSIVAVADQDGNSLVINAYDAWGIPNAGNMGRFGYTGQAWLPELGMWYYKARIYSPTLGRFLQVDPIGYKDQVNLYGYVGNDPANGRDPTGLSCEPNADSKGMTCKLDDPGSLKGGALDRVNRVYTRTVNRLLYHPNRPMVLQARDAKDNTVHVTTTAGKVAESLIQAHASYAGEAAPRADLGGFKAAAETVGSVNTPSGVRMTLYAGALRRNDWDLGVFIGHEGAHGTVASSELRAMAAPNNKDWQIGHQQSFNNAVAQALAHYDE